MATQGFDEVRIYLCASVDMAEERAALREQVVPRLLQRLAAPGLTISFVDPEALPTGPRDLASRWRAIDACRPFFVGLFGERDGGLPAQIDDALLAAQPWLRGLTACSSLEIETAYALTRQGGAGRSFFYLRSPAFIGQVPPPRQAIYLAASELEARRMAAFKESVRRSRRPVLDGYPCRWDPTRQRPAGLEVLVERLVRDLELAIRSELGRIVNAARGTPMAAAAPAAPTPATPPVASVLPVHDNVQFTVYRPRAVEPMRWETLLAFAHLSDLPIEAPADEPDPIEKVKKRARQLLGDRACRYVDVRQDSSHAIPHEAEITFFPVVPGFEFNPPRCTFLWLESVHEQEFRMRAHAGLDGQVVQGRFSVFWGSLLLAEIQLSLRVDSSVAAHASASAMAAARPFDKVFASYSHKDVAVVEEVERATRSLGTRYLRDAVDLRAGEEWSAGLEKMIREADIFQLFWSWNSLRSRHVEQEWRYALSLGRPDFVRPTFWEDPRPADPQLDLPPQELDRLHFYRLYRGEGSRQASPSPRPTSAPAVPGPPPVPPASASPASTPAAKPQVALPAHTSHGRPARRTRWMGSAALVFAGVLGLSLVVQMQQGPGVGPGRPTSAASGPPPLSGKSSGASAESQYLSAGSADRDSVPGQGECRLTETDLNRLRSRAAVTGPIVRVFTSADLSAVTAVRELLIRDGQEPFIRPVAAGDHYACAVEVGPFSKRSAANSAALHFRTLGLPAAVVRTQPSSQKP
ncbi:MAG TPA: TIR domain-containing protein [Thermoanaerobaculia bacterium]|nr:TIR domain-containing protein [Thermoanaerobaculia bacterium]